MKFSHYHPGKAAKDISTFLLLETNGNYICEQKEQGFTTEKIKSKELPPFSLRKPGTGGAVRAKFLRILSNTICVSFPDKSTLT